MNFDYAHRYPYQKIARTIKSENDKRIRSLINVLTIPHRRFGKINKGNKVLHARALGLYGEVLGATNAAKKKNAQQRLIKFLNSSPYNLRPGNPSINRSIGGRLDLPQDDQGYLSDQGEALYQHHVDYDTDEEDLATIRDSTSFSRSQMRRFEDGINEDIA